MTTPRNLVDLDEMRAARSAKGQDDHLTAAAATLEEMPSATPELAILFAILEADPKLAGEVAGILKRQSALRPTDKVLRAAAAVTKHL